MSAAQLYRAAVAADAAFAVELERVYGARAVAERYRMRERFPDPTLEAAHRAKLSADAALRAALRTTTKGSLP